MQKKEFTLTKSEIREVFNGFVDNLKDDEIVYISKILSGSVNASKKNKYMEISFGVHPKLFKDNGTSISGLINSNCFIVVVPNKKDLNPEIVGEKK